MNTTARLLATTGCIAVSPSIAVSAQAAGSAGELDPTFGQGGVVTTAFPGRTAAPVAI